ncbi:hypothetical protein [Haladaptatus sp. DYF46]|uniref:hypothetical protein n=1 Tax=Haladaptatus sp. DYF46 TaxID=2886041 RepID=UPI001E3F5924|nr:hypothetical protein [Haladaptatus sp. DYF46]
MCCGGSSEATAFNEPATVELGPNEKAKLTFRPKQSDTEFFLPTLAISKRPDTVYEVRVDGTTRFGPANIPPTDIDDSTATFTPPLIFQRKLEVWVRNFSSSTKSYHIQPVGYERAGGA